MNAPDRDDLVDEIEGIEQRRDARVAAAEIRTAEQRLDAWARACTNGSTNVITVDGVTYSWDARPRRLQNGALQGRVYAQGRSENARDIGGFKIDAGGHVVHVPRELAGVLPGSDSATTNTEGEEA